MIEKPKPIIFLMILWLLLAAIFIVLAQYSFFLVIDVPNWVIGKAQDITSMIFFGSILSTVVFFVFAGMFVILAYGTFKADHWVWTTGLIIATIFLSVFGLMLASFLVTVWLLPTSFSTQGLSMILISTFIDLGIIYELTRPKTRIYFKVERGESSFL